MTTTPRHNWRLAPGQPYPLGATWDGHGVNFALFSANGEKVELCLFDERGRREVARIHLKERTGDIWHGYLPDARPGLRYGYRVYGPYDPLHGHRFNHHKLLLDPYARAHTSHIRWSDANFGYRVGSPRKDLSFDRRDSAHSMPKCVVVDPAFTWPDVSRPGGPWPETVIYELHLKGYTMAHPEVPESLRGTAAGLAEDAVIEHLLQLGVTAVELLPVQAALSSRWLVERGLSNYWGYATMGFFAPDPRFIPRGGPQEFRRMVDHLHAAGIEVILDVVYNHTGEGSELGPTLSFRGIDNLSYYRLNAEDPRYYDDVTGTGNTLDFTHPGVSRLVMDSLRLWAGEYRIDGFRFDLGTTLARTGNGFDSGAGFIHALRQDPALAQTRLIMEPWDIGPGGYRLGQFGAPFAEWNDRYRDAVRRFWRGDEGMLAELGGRLLGSSDLFEPSGRRPWASINFVTCHDGFTLADLVSYSHKHNASNGEDNRDGTDENYSDNYGVEGPTEDSAINALRRRQRRNMLATLLLSQGTPMLLAGDELGRSQLGNNNAWCQDNELSWLDWGRLDAQAQADIDFIAGLITFRREHPILRAARYLHATERDEEGVEDVLWFDLHGEEFTHEQWHRPKCATVGLLLNGRAAVGRDVHGRTVHDACLLVILHAGATPVRFRLPERPAGSGWRLVLDTARDPPWHQEDLEEVTLELQARSVAVLERLPQADEHAA
ncbi:MAG: glycogen debranching protein GlgX [Gammaproteobacteria bacterium]